MKSDKPVCVRRLYSLYPEQVEKLEILSATLGVNQSKLLRRLIDSAFKEHVVTEPQSVAAN